jgi:cytochrome c peroxidase
MGPLMESNKSHISSVLNVVGLHRQNLQSMKTLPLLAVLVLVACQQSPQPEAETVPDALMEKASALFKPLPAAPDHQTPLARLGKKLYYETALSANNQLSCNSCHKLDQFGVDNLPTSPGHEGKNGERNSPTVLNASLHMAQFWDGRAADLAEQAKGPILNPVEMGLASADQCVSKLEGLDQYPALFAEAFPGEEKPLTYDNLAKAIAAFEATLLTPSPFDRYLTGDASALTAEQQKGLETFINTGCITCHMGVGLGANMYQKFGLVNGPYWEYTGSTKQDEGRSAITGNEAEKYFFKVPSLRNVAETAPYFHDGSVASLSDAVNIMAQTQLNKELTAEETAAIVAFLKSLTGQVPTHALPNETI